MAPSFRAGADEDTNVYPLSGIRIVDFSRHMSAPYGTVVLGDFGADVIKVESLPDGDPSRTTGAAFVDGESGLFLQWNRSKRSIAIDLKCREGLDIALRLIDQADVLVENYRPGIADEIGIGYDVAAERNPGLIYCSLSAFGREGPYAESPGTDPVIQAMSGVMSLTGERGGGPILVGVPVADFTAAMTLVQGVLFGLMARARTGRGQRVDISMLGALLFSLTTRLATYWTSGTDSQRYGSAHSVVAPYQTYETADGEVVAGAWAADGWPRFCRAVGRPDLETDSRFATNPDRLAHRDELNAELVPLFKQCTTTEWEERFRKEQALFGPVLTISQALAQPQAKLLDMVQSMNHAHLGAIPQLASAIKLSETPAKLRLPPPVFAQHTAEVLAEANYSPSEIADLAKRGVVLIHDE